jgi:hypothetical protein
MECLRLVGLWVMQVIDFKEVARDGIEPPTPAFSGMSDQ